MKIYKNIGIGLLAKVSGIVDGAIYIKGRQDVKGAITLEIEKVIERSVKSKIGVKLRTSYLENNIANKGGEGGLAYNQL